MGRAPCCEKESVKRGPWTPEEDAKLLACISQHGTGSWRTLPKKAGLQRCGKSCRLRWTNYLRPDLKHGRFSDHEEQMIVKLHAALGSRWSLIAAQLPGRTDNDVKNYWNTRLKKKLCEMGIDPITHKPISQLLADLAGSISFPKGGQIAEAALGCFKDDMLNVLMRKRPDWQLEGISLPTAPAATSSSGQLQLWELGAPPQIASPQKSTVSTIYERSCNNSVAVRNVDSGLQKLKNGMHMPAAAKDITLPLPLLNRFPSELFNVSQPILAKNDKNSTLDDMSSYPPHVFSCQQEDLSKSVMDAILDSTSFVNDPRPLHASYGAGEASSSMPAIAWMVEDNMECLMPCASMRMDMEAAASHLSQQHQHSLFMNLLQQQKEESSPTESQSAHVILEDLAPYTSLAAWSPSGTASSCSSTSLAGGDEVPSASSLDGVLNTEALLWDFSELSSIIS